MWRLLIKRKGTDLLIIVPPSVDVQVGAFMLMSYEPVIGSYSIVLK